MIQLTAKVVAIKEVADEDGEYRLITVRGPKRPWPANPYEEYTFRDDVAQFKIGDAVVIRVDLL